MIHDKLKNLQPGESVFVADTNYDKLRFIRRAAQQLGITVTMWTVRGDDPIYPGQHGVRVKRLT